MNFHFNLHVIRETFDLCETRPRYDPPPAICTYVGRFPTDDGLVAPGMSCSYTVRFTPDSLADFQDELTVGFLTSK